MDNLAEWLKAEFDRNPRLNQTAVALSIKVGQSTISKWLKGVSTPDPVNCRKLARFFNVPEQQVLVLAGHLSPDPNLIRETQARYRTSRCESILDLLDQLDDEQLESLRHFLESMV